MEGEGGTTLVNTGSWVYSPGLLGSTAADSPYWPGTIGVLEGTEVELRYLLDDAPHAQSATGSRTRTAEATTRV